MFSCKIDSRISLSDYVLQYNFFLISLEVKLNLLLFLIYTEFVLVNQMLI